MSTMCDVCSGMTEPSEGYAFTTTEVTTEPKYWEFMLGKFSYDEDLLKMYVEQQANQYTGWLLCESCSNMFSFDKSKRKGYAQRMESPPGCGPANVNSVIIAASKAWQNKNGKQPFWGKTKSWWQFWK